MMRFFRRYARMFVGIGALVLALVLTFGVWSTASAGSALGGGSGTGGGVDIRDPSHAQGITISRRALTSEPYRVAGYGFYGTSLNANYITTTATGTGAVTVASGRGTLATGATANSTVEVRTVATARIIAGFDNVHAFGLKVPAGVTNNVRAWGVGPDAVSYANSTDGVYWQLSGTTWNVCSRKASVESCVPSASWTGYAADACRTAIANAASVTYTYAIQQLSTVAAFDINGNPCHTLTSVTGTGGLTQNGDFHPFVANVNSGGSTTNVTLDVVTILSLRHDQQQHVAPIYTHITTNTTTTLKSGGAHLRNITINKKGGSANTVTVYDSPTGSGTVVAVIDTTAAGGSFVYDVDLDDGLTIVTASGAAPDITVVWD